jgi:hypothetical protein
LLALAIIAALNKAKESFQKMREIVCLIFCLFTVQVLGETLSYNLLDDKQLNSHIHRVKVYNDGAAEVTHHLTLHLQHDLTEGETHDIIVSGFPFSLKENSLKVLSTNDVKVQDFRISVLSYLTEEYPFFVDKYDEIKSAIQEIDFKLQDLSFQEESLTNLLNSIRSYTSHRASSSSASSSPSSSLLSIPEFTDLMKYQESESSKIYSRLLTINKEKSAKMKEKDWLNELVNKFFRKSSGTMNNQYGNSLQIRRRTIEEKQLQVRIQLNHQEIQKKPGSSAATTGKDVEFSLHYLVQPATWDANYIIKINDFPKSSTTDSVTPSLKPERELQHDASGSSYQMEIEFYANVYQNSGMDWKNIELLLSTTHPEYIDDIKNSFPEKKGVYFKPKLPMYAHKMRKSGAAVMMAGGMGDMGGMRGSDVMEASPAMADGGMMYGMSAKMSNTMESADISTNSVNGIDYSYVYTVQHLVNLDSHENIRKDILPINNDFNIASFSSSSSSSSSFITSTTMGRPQHLMFIKSITIPINIFTFISPSKDSSSAYRIGFGRYPMNETPLISSSSVQIELNNDYVGSSSLNGNGMKSNELFQQNLGKDSLITVSYSTFIPKNSQVEEDKSTWFVKDSITYKVITEERTIVIKNGHSSSPMTSSTSIPSTGDDGLMLFIIADSIPTSSEEKDIKVGLLLPTPEELIEDIKANGNDEASLNQILFKEYEKRNEGKLTNGSEKKKSGQKSFIIESVVSKSIYFSKSSGIIYWAIWVNQQTSKELNLSLKYQITRPSDKEVYIY